MPLTMSCREIRKDREQLRHLTSEKFAPQRNEMAEVGWAQSQDPGASSSLASCMSERAKVVGPSSATVPAH